MLCYVTGSGSAEPSHPSQVQRDEVAGEGNRLQTRTSDTSGRQSVRRHHGENRVRDDRDLDIDAHAHVGRAEANASAHNKAALTASARGRAEFVDRP